MHLIELHQKIIYSSSDCAINNSASAETVLGFFGFGRTVYSDSKKRRRKWYEELRERNKGYRNRCFDTKLN